MKGEAVKWGRVHSVPQKANHRLAIMERDREKRWSRVREGSGTAWISHA